MEIAEMPEIMGALLLFFGEPAARQSWRGVGEGERYRNTNSNRLSA